MMRKYGASLLQTFAEGPSLMAPEQLGALRALAETQHHEGLIAAVSRMLGDLGLSASRGRRQEEEARAPETLCATFGARITDRSKPFAFSEGVAFIPVWGVLLHRDPWCDSSATGYDFIRRQFDAAMADPDVRGIVFDVNSPGGHVAGNFELADEIFAARSKKPSLAVVDSMAYSGGYSLGSSASRMVATPSGGVGSIGVVMMHVSVQALMEKLGIDINFIHAGAHKVDGNMFKALPDDVRARYQASVERSYEKFVGLVARNRSMDPEKVRATEALCYCAEDGLSLGLIDAIQTPKDALAAFRAELFGSSTISTQGAKQMSDNTEKTGEGGESTTVITAAADTKPAASPLDPQAAVVAERQRINAILSCEEAKGREDLARHFALETDMGVDAARKALAAAPKAEKAASQSPFVAAMNASEHPNVGATDGSDMAEMSVGQRIAANFHVQTGGAFRRASRE